MRKIIISFLMVVLLSSVAFAAVTRSGGGTSVTYSTTMATTYSKAYWAVDDIVGSGCSGIGVSCSVTNGDCSYVGGAIRVVGYTVEAGGNMPSSITVSVSGTGSCSLNNGNYVESYPGNLGSSTLLSGSVSLSLSVSCNTDADTNCDGCVHDTEFPSAVNDWKGSQTYISDSEFPTVVNKWKSQEGC